MRYRLTFAAVCGLFVALVAPPAWAQRGFDSSVDGARDVLDEVMRTPNKSVPKKLLRKAEGIVVIPNMIKGGFIVGVRSGRGVALIKNEKGGWDAPRLVTMSGGSVGFQAGVQSTDVVLLFMTKKSVENLVTGKFTIGADASASAGPVGRELAAATDARLKAEILSYSRSRGLFAGVSLDGSSLQIDPRAEAMYYRGKKTPTSAMKLVAAVDKYASGADEVTTVEDGGTTEKKPETADSLRKSLARSSTGLSKIVDDQWKKYLALPREVYVYDGGEHPTLKVLDFSLARFERVAADAKYKALTEREEFQKTHALLKKYRDALKKNEGPLKLPEPPK
jgi:lipid-binding SYLF domain-containing protein